MRSPRRRTQSQQVHIPAPVAGIVENVPVVSSGASHAEYIENFLPTLRGLRVRGGTQSSATLPGAVLTLFSYASGASQQLFGATDSDIYDIAAPGVSVVSGQSGGVWSFQQIGTSGGQFLIGVNGVNGGQKYDGVAWSELTATEIQGIDTANLKQVWSYRNRLLFVENNSLVAWFLPVGSVGGAALDLDLSGVFVRGGTLMFGATWSLDSGDGMDDKCVFVTTEGEVAIYAGSDPANAADWALEGRYEIGRPLGARATMRVGGDLLIGTDDGIIPLSAVFTKDAADLSLAAVSRPIKTTWSVEVARAVRDIQFVKWTRGEALLVFLPDAARMMTANLQTSAWAFQTGWDGVCAAELGGDIYVGDDTGLVKQIDVTGSDMGNAFVARFCGAFQDYGDPISFKTATLMRGAYFADLPFKAKYSVSTNFTVNFPTAPVTKEFETDVLIWDQGNWGQKIWARDVEDPRQGKTDDWVSVAGVGSELAPMVQITSGGVQKLTVEVVRIDMMVDLGGRVV